MFTESIWVSVAFNSQSMRTVQAKEKKPSMALLGKATEEK